MGIECGECEHDLRRGHWIGCSRYNLADGVARAMLKAIGEGVDPDDEFFVMPPKALTAAQAAIDHMDKVREARAKGGEHGE